MRTWNSKGYYDECYGFVDEDGCHCNLFDGIPQRVATDPDGLGNLEIPKMQVFSTMESAFAFLRQTIASGDITSEKRTWLYGWKVEELTQDWFLSLPMVYEVTCFDN